MGADAAIVDAATWTAVAAAACLVIRASGVLAFGVAIAVAGAGVAFAASGEGHRHHPPAFSVDWPADSHRQPAAPVTVRPGDCLWDIAGRRLSHPTSAHIATAWPQWWRTNRGVIGADPDLVHPGQRLRPPATSWSPS